MAEPTSPARDSTLAEVIGPRVELPRRTPQPCINLCNGPRPELKPPRAIDGAASTAHAPASDASAIRAKGLAEAEISKAKGLAEADIVKATGFSEAEAMEKKADAWKQYNQAAIIQQLINALPEVAAAISAPLAKTDRIVVISNGGDSAGASKVTADIANIVAQVPATIEALTGVDLISALQQLPGLSKVEE